MGDKTRFSQIGHLDWPTVSCSRQSTITQKGEIIEEILVVSLMCQPFQRKQDQIPVRQLYVC
jgi:hypothetical protein